MPWRRCLLEVMVTIQRCVNVAVVYLVVVHLHSQLPANHAGYTRRYSNTTVYCGIHERSECIPVDCGVRPTNLIHDRRSCVDFTLEVEANVARCVHSSMNKLGVKRNSGL